MKKQINSNPSRALHSLGFVFLILLALACKCESDLFKSGKTGGTTTGTSTEVNSSNTNANQSYSSSTNSNAVNTNSTTANVNSSAVTTNPALSMPQQVGTFEYTRDKKMGAEQRMSEANSSAGYEFTEKSTGKKVSLYLGQYSSADAAKRDIKTSLAGLDFGKLISRKTLGKGEYSIYHRSAKGGFPEEYTLIGHTGDVAMSLESEDAETIEKFLLSFDKFK